MSTESTPRQMTPEEISTITPWMVGVKPRPTAEQRAEIDRLGRIVEAFQAASTAYGETAGGNYQDDPQWREGHAKINELARQANAARTAECVKYTM